MTAAEYNQCVDDHADSLYRFILKNTRDEEAAKDIIQDAYEKMWRKFREISREKAKSYLFTTAYHTLIDYIRKNRYQVSWEPGYETGDEQESFNDLKEVLDEGMKRLPGIQRSVILLRDYEGYSYKEIGEITGLTESQVKVYIFRARTSLKQFIGKPEHVI